MHGVASEDGGAEALSIARDAKVQRCVEDAFQFEREVLFTSFSRKGLSSTRPLNLLVSTNFFSATPDHR